MISFYLFSSLGNRTIHAVDHYNGIVKFGFGWRKLPSNEITWEPIDGLIERFAFSNIDREDGDVIEITVNASDVTNYVKVC